MHHSFRSLAFVTMGAALVVACSSTGASSDPRPAAGELAVRATVSQTIEVDNARAIAIGRDGRTVWAYLDAYRDFTLRLPIGQSYRIVIANQHADGHRVQVAHLTLRGADGDTDRTEWLGANEEGAVDLGVLSPESSRDLELRTYGVPKGKDDCKDAGADASRNDDDGASRPADAGATGATGDGGATGGTGGTVDDLCIDGGDTELEPTHEPGKKCEDKGRGKGKGKGKGHEKGRGKGHEKHGDDPKPCPPKTDGGIVDGGVADGGNGDAGNGGGGDGGVGSECLATSDCMSGLVCLAGICRVPSGGVGSECLVNANCMPGLVCVAGICTAPSGSFGPSL